MSIKFNRDLWWLLLLELRPIQWIKNTLVLAACIFTIPRVSLIMLEKAMLAFLLFSLISGCVYIVNDFIDLDTDAHHPDKCHRPMACGRLDVHVALGFGAILLIISLVGGFALNVQFGGALLAYFVLNVAYSCWLKHFVIVDIFTIAAGFVLRAAAGGFAISVRLTPWFLSCAMMLSLFLAAGKRKHEYRMWLEGGAIARAALRQYTPELLNQLSIVSAASVIMMYSMFTFVSGHSRCLMLTIPLVMYGVFRYAQLVDSEGHGGHPEMVLLKDRGILATVVIYTATVIALLWYFG